MAKYYTSMKVILYLLILIILQPIVFTVLNLDESKLLGIIGHVIIILIGIALIYLHAKYNKDRSNN